MSSYVTRRLGLASASQLLARTNTARLPFHPIHGTIAHAAFAGRSPGQSPGQLRPGSRGIHIVPVVQSSVETAQDLITALHTVTGTPWFVTLPLFALALNSVFRLPFLVYTQRIAQKRTELVPLLRAWSVKIAKTLAREDMPPAQRHKEIEKRYLKTTKRLYKEWGVQQWKMWGSVLSFPFWLCALEAVRRLCGGPRGFLGTLVFGPKAPQDGASAGTAASSTVSSTDPAVANAAAAASEPLNAIGAADTAPAELAASTLQDVVASGADPTLATGGFLWFPNLLEADPLHVLPMLLSAMLVVNLLPSTRAGKLALFGIRDSSSDDTTKGASDSRLAQGRAARGVQRAFLVLALMIGPITADMPSALLLYWISSAGWTYVMRKGITFFMPVPKASHLVPCKGRESPVLQPPPPPQLKATDARLSR